MSNCTPIATPADPCCRLSPEMCRKNPEEEAGMKNVPYREAVGSLMHITVMTRPDISYAVGQTDQFVQNPGKQHWRAVKRILAYLKKTLNLGLRFNKDGDTLTGFCDSDYTGDLQTRDPRADSCFFTSVDQSHGPVDDNSVLRSPQLKQNS